MINIDFWENVGQIFFFNVPIGCKKKKKIPALALHQIIDANY